MTTDTPAVPSTSDEDVTIAHPTQDCPEGCDGLIDATGTHRLDSRCPHDGKTLSDQEWEAISDDA